MRRSKSAIVALVAAVLAVVVMLETGGATAPRELAPLSAHTLTHPSQGIVLAAKKRPAPSPVRVTIARQSRPGIRIPFRVRLVLRDKAVRGARVQISILQAAGAKTKVSPKTGRTNRKGFFRGTVLLSKKPGVTVLLVIAGHYRKGVVIQTAVPTHAPSLPFGLGR